MSNILDNQLLSKLPRFARNDEMADFQLFTRASKLVGTVI